MKMLLGVVLAAGLVAAQRSPDVQLKAALHKEQVEGDLKGAIEMYQKLAASGNRGVAAKALVRLGQCYEKLGDAESRKAYERVVREFADQKDEAAEARRHLAGNAPSAAGGEMAVRRVWSGSWGNNRQYWSISRDGRYLVFTPGEIQQKTIRMSDLQTGETRTIVSNDSRIYNHIVLSPDGRQVAYAASEPDGSNPELRISRTDGSDLRIITVTQLSGVHKLGRPYDWSPDGRDLLLNVQLVGDPEWKMILSPVAGGPLRVIGPGYDVWAAEFSPDGRTVAAERHKIPTGPDADISLFALGDGRETRIVTGGRAPRWTPDGKRLTFISDRRGADDLWSIRVTNGEAEGAPELVKENVRARPLGFSRDGEYFYSSFVFMRDLYTVEIDPQTGRPTSQAKRITDRYVNGGPAWSPDGGFLAYYSERGSKPWHDGAMTIVIRSMAQGEDRVVTPSIPLDPNLAKPQWFPDGRSLFIYPQGMAQRGKLTKVDVQTGDVQLLLNGAVVKPNAYNLYRPGVILSPDGRSVAYIASDRKPEQVRVLWRELAGGEEKELCRLTGSTWSEPSFSPDGRRLAFWYSPDMKANNLMALPVAGGAPVHVRTSKVGPMSQVTMWSRDGKRIFFLGGRADICSVPVEGGEPTCLGIGLNTIWSFDLHPDGKRLVFYDEVFRSDLWALKNVAGVGRAAR